VNNLPGNFVPADHSVLAFALKDGLVSYLESPLSQVWCVHDSRVPIPSSRGARILLRATNISNTQYLNLDIEIRRLLIELSDESALVKTRALIGLSGSHIYQI
jgi:hypothetical protein